MPSFPPYVQPIPVEFYLFGNTYKGQLTEIHGRRNTWWLHGVDLVDVLIWNNGVTWKKGTKDLWEQSSYFEAVLIGWYG